MCTYTHTCICIYVCICICIYACIYMCIHYICIYIPFYVYTHILQIYNRENMAAAIKSKLFFFILLISWYQVECFHNYHLINV